MDELVQFLRARLDEGEKAARSLDAKSWQDTGVDVSLTDDASELVASGRVYGDLFESLSTAEREHIARYDPERALAEVDAWRSVVDFAATYEGSFHASQFLPKLAAVYRDHPDFDATWLED